MIKFSQKAVLMASSVVITRYHSSGGGSTLVRQPESRGRTQYVTIDFFHVRYRTTADSRSPSLIHDVNSLYEKSHFFENSFLVQEV